MHFISDAHNRGQLASDDFFTKQYSNWLKSNSDCNKARLTHSCTAAFEVAAILAVITPGDEAIMPSYTLVSTANAFALLGGAPFFVDIHPDTLSIDGSVVETAITPITKATNDFQ